jgi:two-component system sensor histidine kinase PilS (NtrC family)
MNRVAEQLLGKEVTELQGRSVTNTGLFSPSDWREQTERCTGPNRIRHEVEISLGDKAARTYFGFSLSPLTNAHGMQDGYILVFQDLTEWRKLQEELRIKDRMAAVGEMAAGLAHEIGNPLASISGSVQMLAPGVQGRPQQEKLVEILVRESQRLDRTVKSFLQFARPKERSSVPFDIAQLLAEHVQLLRNSPEATEGHRIHLELRPQHATVIADPDQISQIFWNLARNALRAMPDGGSLRVSGQRQGNVYRLSVRDDGRGMTEEERANLFHPYQSFFDQGTGIGMAIVYRIVEEHGGRLAVDSVPGSGTMIMVELPVGEVSEAILRREALR